MNQTINYFGYIGEDIFVYLLGYLDDKYLIDTVQLVNSLFYRTVMLLFGKKYMTENYLKNIYPKIFLEQGYAIRKLNEIRNDMDTNDDKTYIICYNSPMGTGKTAISLYMALQSKNPTFILVNTRILSAWLDEVKKFGIYDRDPKKSKVLFIHSSINNLHVNYSKNNKLDHKIIITTKYYYDNGLRNYLINGNAIINIIIDEAHLHNTYFISGLIYRHSTPLPIKEILLVSASPIHLGKFCGNGDIVKYDVKCKSFNLNTKLIENRININNIGGKYAKLTIFDKFVENPSLSVNGIERMICQFEVEGKIYDRIVIFSHCKLETLRAFARDLNKKIEDYYVFTFSNKAVTHMDIFRKKRCITLCNYLTAIEGVNFSEADCAIYYDIDYNSPEKARQGLGRIRRKNNTLNNIDIYFVMYTANDIRYIQGRLNKIYALNKKILLLDKKSQSTMNNIIKYLTDRQYKIANLTDMEILLLFSKGNYEFDNVDINIEMKDFLTQCYKI